MFFYFVAYPDNLFPFPYYHANPSGRGTVLDGQATPPPPPHPMPANPSCHSRYPHPHQPRILQTCHAMYVLWVSALYLLPAVTITLPPYPTDLLIIIDAFPPWFFCILFPVSSPTPVLLLDFPSWPGWAATTYYHALCEL